MNRLSRISGTILLAVLALSSCGRGAVTEEREHPSVVVTQWNDATELFLEYPHLLAGEATGNWAIHLSDMKTFQPITAGTLVVRFLKGDRQVEAFTLEAPARDGIYLLDPVIEEPGTYEVRLELNGPQTASRHTLPEVRVFASAAELPEEEEAAGGVSFLKEQQWKIPFAVEPAGEWELARTIGVPGEIVARDDGFAEVSAPTDGIALAAPNRGAPSVGDRVGSGEVMVILSPAAGEGGYARARGDLARLESEVARAERLYAAGAVPEKRLEAARRELQVARAEIAAIGGGVDGDYRLRVRAPIAGVVAERSFVPGGRVAAGQPLYTIVDPRTLWLRVQVPPDAAAALDRSASAIVRVEGLDRELPPARLVSVGSVLAEETRTVPAIFAVDNADGALRVGQFARASIPVGGTVEGVAIPNAAILDDNGIPVAFVQLGGETFERRILRLGPTDGRRTLVTDGIREGEMVVTEGGYQVRLASMSGESFSGGHAH